MRVIVIAIAGGSGAGKSTLSYALADESPKIFEVINFDDYHKLKTDPDLPMLGSQINWDHPDIINWNELIADVKRLKNNQPITINSWAHRSNPDYESSGNRIRRTILPKPIIIIEGYLALYNPALNKLYDKTYYLDLNEAARLERRNKNTIIDNREYVSQVLLPMHHKYVEPTKQNADTVIDVAKMSVHEIQQLIMKDLGIC